MATPILVAWRSKVEMCSSVLPGNTGSNHNWLISICVLVFRFPMHLSLIKGPFFPIIWYQVRGSLLCANVPGGPQTSTFHVLWAQGKKQICAFFLSEKSQKMNSLHVPKQGPYAERFPFTGLFYISLKFVIKISLSKENFPFSQRR